MEKPELIVVAGCNAAGKSTFIRSRLSELGNFQVLMTDVYKARTKALFQKAIKDARNIIIETVFNDDSFKDLIDLANNTGYQTSLIALFLDNLQQSVNRVAVREAEQNGVSISGNNVKINFNESFKNLASYFFYFDRSEFIYTGVGEINRPIMSFAKSKIMMYNTNELIYPQLFADHSFGKGRMKEEAFKVIKANVDYK